jgi:hypothetical protein
MPTFSATPSDAEIGRARVFGACADALLWLGVGRPQTV